MDRLSPLEDAAEYIFSSLDEYAEFVKAFYEGYLDQLEVPEDGAIALYLDDTQNVILVGRVLTDELDWRTGGYIVETKIPTRSEPIQVPSYTMPLDDIESVIWVSPDY